MKSYLWTQNPDISSAPIEILEHFLYDDGEELCEAAVLRLENGNFLFIRFQTSNRKDENIGFTDYEEFDNCIEPTRIYQQTIGEENEKT